MTLSRRWQGPARIAPHGRGEARNARPLRLQTLLVACLLSTYGGAAGASSGSYKGSSFDGVYIADLTAAADPESSILIFIDSNNMASIALATDTYVDYPGSGTLNGKTLEFTGEVESPIDPTPVQPPTRPLTAVAWSPSVAGTAWASSP